MIKIAICGKARSGKNTLANLLSKYYNGNVVVEAFANPIKQIALKIIPSIPREWLYGSSELRENIIPGTDKTVRDLLKELGKVGRSYDEDCWAKQLMRRVPWYMSANLLVVSDLRMPNELRYLKDDGFFLIKLKRDDVPRSEDISETAQDQIDESEFDAIIYNNQTIEDLKIAVNNLIISNKNRLKPLNI
jgi:hypothetical protein